MNVYLFHSTGHGNICWICLGGPWQNFKLNASGNDWCNKHTNKRIVNQNREAKQDTNTGLE